MYSISDNKEKLQIDSIMHLLSQSYWAEKRSLEKVKLSMENSICFGAYLDDGGKQIAFARAVTDFVCVYYLCDVIVDEEYRGKGIGKALVSYITADERLKSLHGILATRDAHGLYEKFGFSAGGNHLLEKRV